MASLSVSRCVDDFEKQLTHVRTATMYRYFLHYLLFIIYTIMRQFPIANID